MSTSPPPVRPAAWLSSALRARLRGAAPPPAPCDAPEALRERARDDPRARAWLRALDLERRQADRVARAIAFEGTAVVLADGSSMTLDEAEKTLAAKEQERVHTALRRSLDEARSRSLGGRSGFETGTAWQPPEQFDRYESEERGGIDAVRARLEAFLVGTRDARDAALEQLAGLAGGSLHVPTALERALDLPEAAGAFSDEAASALLAAARGGAPAPQRPLRRVRVPRRLTGVRLEDEEGVFLGVGPPVLRFARHARTVLGGAACLGRAIAHGEDTRGARAAAVACGLALLTAPARRAALGVARAQAERAERIAWATLLLETRASCALWCSRSASAGASEDREREALMDALGADPGRVGLWERLDALEEPSLALAEVDAGRAYLLLRDGFDEAFALRGEAWRALEDPALAEPAVEPREPLPPGAPPRPAEPQRTGAREQEAWAQLVFERA